VNVLLDDHLIRDLLADDMAPELVDVLRDNEPATTNLYLYRLCRSAVASTGGALTGAWSFEQRRALGRQLVALPVAVRVVPMAEIAFRMAEVAADHRLSALGAEAVAAVEHLQAVLCVAETDDGPNIRAAVAAIGADHRTIIRRR
jgi:hypothetical protein